MKMNLKRLLVSSIVVLFLLMGGFVISNSIDQELNPEIDKLLKRYGKPVQQENNAYFYMVGLQSNASENEVYNAGKKVQESYEYSIDNPTHRSENPNFYKPHYDGLQVLSGDLELCVPKSKNKCFALYKTNKKNYNQMLAADQNKMLLQRYEKLLDYHVYEEPLESYPARRKIRSIHSLYLVSIYKDVESKQYSKAMARLLKSHQFWRNISASKGNLGTKEISIDIVSMNLGFLLEMVEDCKPCRKQQNTIMQMLTPVMMDEISLAEGIKREYVRRAIQVTNEYHNRSALSYYDLNDWLTSKFALINALHNSAYKIFSAAEKHFSLTSKEKYKNERAWKEFITDFDDVSYLDMYFNYTVSQFRINKHMPDFEGLYRGSEGLDDSHKLVKYRFNEVLQDKSIK